MPLSDGSRTCLGAPPAGAERQKVDQAWGPCPGEQRRRHVRRGEGLFPEYSLAGIIRREDDPDCGRAPARQPNKPMNPEREKSRGMVYCYVSLVLRALYSYVERRVQLPHPEPDREGL